MDEELIKKQYVEKPNKEVKLLCSYTTRREGFLDILLSGLVLSSEEARKLLGKIKTHRSFNQEERFHYMNDNITLSTGFVSFRYSNPSIQTQEDYIGGFGVLVPLEKILEYPNLSFSHCSDAGEIKNYDLNRDNIAEAVHKARKKKELYDDGYGNLFEVALEPKLNNPRQKFSYYRNIATYPRLDIKEGVTIAIPENERENITRDLIKRQKEYKRFLDKIAKEDKEKLKWKTIDERNLFWAEELIEFMEKMTLDVDLENLPIFWYPNKNLDTALQYLAIS